MSRRSKSTAAVLVGLLVLLGLIGGMIYAGFRILDRLGQTKPVPVAQQCVARSGDASFSLSPEQAMNASIITAESIRRGLPARAATIALATAMQESRLQNIDYGDRDSVGLFQQRTSQGWGTIEQIMDPWYSAGQFYDHLVKVKNWQTGDINDVAQAVQRSGVPDGYRKHVESAKVWSSVLTGNTAAGLTCLTRDGTPEYPNPKALDQILTKGLKGKVSSQKSGTTLTVTADSAKLAWASAAMAMSTLQNTPISSIEVAGQTWTHNSQELATWQQGTPSPQGATTVVVHFG